MRLLAIALTSVFFLNACGPEQSVKDQQESQKDTIINDAKANLSSIEGKYCGQLIVPNNSPMPVALYLRAYSVLQPDTGDLGITEIPTVMGILTSKTTEAISYSFDSGILKDHVLKMHGTSNNLPIFLQLEFKGDKIAGEFLGQRGPLQVSFNRTKNIENGCK
jgi:hypothetical protein